MAVIVSSSVTQCGSLVSGNTVHVIAVKTKPGYSTDPGRAGTGTVAAFICQRLVDKNSLRGAGLSRPPIPSASLISGGKGAQATKPP